MRILGLRGISLPVVPRDYVHLMAITNVVIQNNILYLFTKKKKKKRLFIKCNWFEITQVVLW